MSLHIVIQDAILAEIARPEFSAALPPLSDKAWRNIVDRSPHSIRENERLEFLGDAMMYAALGDQLYKQLPDGTPALFTNIRGALHSNLTFSRLAEKLDILAVSDYVLKALTARTFGEGTSAPEKRKCHVKATADLFETVIGSYYLERGYAALCSWVEDLYCPLVVVSKRAYADHFRLPPKQGSRMAAKKIFSPMKPVKILVKSKKSILKHSLTKKPILATSGRTSRSSLIPHRIITPRRPIHRSGDGIAGSSRSLTATVKVKPTFIDLTGLEDSDTETGPMSIPSRPIPNNPASNNAGTTAVVTSSLSMESMEFSDDNIQDMLDETFLEQMLVNPRTPSQ